MYDHLQGRVIRKEPTRLVLRVGGVGYDLRVSLHTASGVEEGEEALLRVHLHVVDGSPLLLGFTTDLERELCRRLLAVAGVGPSTALAVLSTDTPRRVASAIHRGEARALTRVKGIGPRTAERICLELRDAVAPMTAGAPEEAPLSPEEAGALDAVAALVTLGFPEREARRRVEAVLGAGRARVTPVPGAVPEPVPGAEEIIRMALRDEGA